MWINLRTTVANPNFVVRAGIRNVPDSVANALFEMQKEAKAKEKDFELVSKHSGPQRNAKQAD